MKNMNSTQAYNKHVKSGCLLNLANVTKIWIYNEKYYTIIVY